MSQPIRGLFSIGRTRTPLAYAASLCILLFFSACNDDPVTWVGCTEGVEEVVLCDEGRGSLRRLCIEGTWQADSCEAFAHACEDGAQQHTVCSNGARLVQSCVNGAWEQTRSCDDQCTPGETSTRVCGWNNQGTQLDQCSANGVWEDGDCNDPDVCRNGAAQTATCLDYGTQDQRCLDGQWANEGACDIECLEDSTRQIFCGLNERTPLGQTCEHGIWLDDTHCDDPDECLDNSVQILQCDQGTIGQRLETCHVGQWDNAPCGGSFLAGTTFKHVLANGAILAHARFCALDHERQLQCFGNNAEGQHGLGHTDPVTGWASADTPALDGFCQGNNHMCALSAAGDVYCWGNNDYGQLGDDSIIAQPSPTLLSGVSAVVELACGAQHTCALRSNGRVTCWGNNDHGQHGNGHQQPSLVPTNTINVGTMARIFAAGNHSCTIDNSGQLYCWGENDHGQLGDNSLNTALTPKAISGMTSVSDVALGSQHSCAIHANRAYCWGNNSEGALGDGTFTNQRKPTEVQLNRNVHRIAAGADLSCAIGDDAWIFCWGTNQRHELGRGQNFSASKSAEPQRVLQSNGSADVAIAVSGLLFTSNTVCSLQQNGAMKCWGFWPASFPELEGNGGASTPRALATPQ